MKIENWLEKIIELGTEYGLRVLGAFLIWIIGGWTIKKIMLAAKKLMIKRNLEESLQKFLLDLINWGFKVLLVLVILAKLGIETTSFAAILASAGLAVGMALQGSLGNFAGGILIMIFKPFKIGDLIEAQGEMGTVKEIEIFTTKLIGLSNKEIIIPNGVLSNGNIVNYNTQGTRRVDLVFGISYDANIKETKDVLMKVLTDHPLVLKDPAPTVNVLALADSSVNFAVRPWCNTPDYWTVYFDVMENTKLALDAAGIEIPYPHQVEIQKPSKA